MSYIKKAAVFLFAVILTALPTSCSGKMHEHRLQWWLESVSWDVGDRDGSATGEGIRVAVIDTGIDMTHPDLTGKVISEQRIAGASEENNFEHGTAVAGIICGQPGKDGGILGIAPNAKIISVDISDGDSADASSLAEGIDYAVSCGVDIINISAGTLTDDAALRAAVDRAIQNGAVIVAASGNDMCGDILYPARYENVISVNSVDEKGNKLFGEESKSVYAPGGNIVTAYSSAHETKKFASFTGTSMSAPIISGAIALILQKHPDISNSEICSYFSGYGKKLDIKEILADFDRLYQQ